MAKEIDWVSIRNEYVNTNISQRDLAKKHHISDSTLTKRANKEKWQHKRATQCNKIALKLQQSSADAIIKKEVNRIERIMTLSDKLIEKMERAAEQLEDYIATNKIKVKTVRRDDKNTGTPYKETTIENENITILQGIVDRVGVKQLASALKDIKEVQAGYEKNAHSGEIDPLTQSLIELARELDND